MVFAKGTEVYLFSDGAPVGREIVIKDQPTDILRGVPLGEFSCRGFDNRSLFNDRIVTLSRERIVKTWRRNG